MTQKHEAQPGQTAGLAKMFPSGNSCELTPSLDKKQALTEAKRDLIRQALFEDLDAVRLYVETALLLIEARDDFGTIYAIDRGAAHYRAIVGAKKELGSLREGSR